MRYLGFGVFPPLFWCPAECGGCHCWTGPGCGRRGFKNEPSQMLLKSLCTYCSLSQSDSTQSHSDKLFTLRPDVSPEPPISRRQSLSYPYCRAGPFNANRSTRFECMYLGKSQTALSSPRLTNVHLYEPFLLVCPRP